MHVGSERLAPGHARFALALRRQGFQLLGRGWLAETAARTVILEVQLFDRTHAIVQRVDVRWPAGRMLLVVHDGFSTACRSCSGPGKNGMIPPHCPSAVRHRS